MSQISVTMPGPEPAALIERFNNLHDGPLVLADVIRRGEPAIAPLEAFLRGPSQALHHPRCLAADALAAIGTPAAITALVRALHDSIERDPGPVLLEAESILVNHIADHLAEPHRAEKHRPQVTEALLAALSRRAYPACARALGRLQELRAIPLLIDCLQEDTARAAAVAALRSFGSKACMPLAQALAARQVRHGQEPPSCIDGRAAAARLLGELADARVAPWVRRSLSQALDDPEAAVRLEAALALARCATGVIPKAASVLTAELAHVSWARVPEIQDALARIAPAAAHH
jgi:HEAT repeat protein